MIAEGNSGTVVLGPMIEFHAGIQGSLVDCPPPGIDYRVSTGRAHYWHPPRTDWSPLEHMAVDEMVELSPTPLTGGRHVVHSSRVPAGGGVPWVVDCDCLLATIRYGRDFMFGHAEDAPRRLDTTLSAIRVKRLVRRFLADDCFGVLFNTDTFRRSFLDFMDDDHELDPVELRLLDRRCGVVVPAVGVGERAPRPTRGPLRVCFASRAGALKGQEVALAVFDRLKLRRGTDVELFWLGQPPPSSRFGSAEIHPTLSRPDYLELIASCDVYFAPSTSETLGMAMLEAAALGAVVVTGAGPGVPHMSELFSHGEDAIVIPTGDREQRVRDYVAALDHLVDERDSANGLADAAHRRALRRLSERNRRLLDRYGTMFEAHGRTMASTTAVPVDGPAASGLWKSSVDLALLEKVHGRRWADGARNHLTFDDDGLRAAD